MLANDKFIHLHLHSQYSLLDGAIRVKELVESLPKKGMHAAAITDHGVMFSAISFYLDAIANNVKPIIGCEFYLTPGSRFEKKEAMNSVRYHLVLLAETTEGYKNLIQLSSTSFLDGFYYKPRIDKEILRKHSKGLIALSACLSGELNVLLSMGDEEGAEKAALEYQDIFGKNNFFIEIQRQGLSEQENNNKKLVEMSRKLDIPLVATNDCHYLEKDDWEAHDVLLCIQTGSMVSDQERMRMDTHEFYVKSPDEMLELFSDLPEACSNTVKIAQRCNVVIETGKLQFPKYDVPENYDLNTYLEKIVYDGLEERLPRITLDNPEKSKDELREEYITRLQMELEVIRNTGFSGYFLIVWDFIRYARKQNIPVGPGRGSGAGSLVAYVMRITDIDPIKYNLLFQRFLNPDRISPPDFDIDFCWRERPKVIEYVRDKYGAESVAQIITFNALGAKAAIKDVARVMAFPYDESNKITKMVPDELDITIEKALTKSSDLSSLYKKDIRVKKLINIAKRIEGLIRHASIHAAGVVITSGKLVDYLPLYKGSKDEIITQFAMGDIEKIGLLKMDFLGLRTLTVISDALKLIKYDTGKEVDIDNIPLDDEKTYTLFKQGDTTGIFQFESTGMRDLLRKVEPTEFNDLIALNALYRPGPLKSGMVDDYVNRKHGHKKIKYALPVMEEFLSETYGTIVYQEQVMQLASALAGFSLGEADLLRRAMGKKKTDVMAAQRERFAQGAKERNINPAISKKIFDTISNFAEYGFNKSHSTAYALIAYQTAYLKANFSVHFMAALLSSEAENTDKVAKYIKECKDMNVEVTRPDINISFSKFTVKDDKILFGLSAIKNVGSKAVESIIEAREAEGPFKNLFEFCRRINLRAANRRVLEQLINSGGMDTFLKNRASMMFVLDKAIEAGNRASADADSGQLNMFAGDYDDEGLFQSFLPADFKEWTEKEVLVKEKESLGFYVTGHPLSGLETELKRFSSVNLLDLKSRKSGEEVRVSGLLVQIKERDDKKNNKMATAVLEDLYSSTSLIIFASVYNEVHEKLQYELPVLIKGKLDTDGNEPKIIVREISLLSQVKLLNTKEVLIKIMLPGMDNETIKLLDNVFKKYPGSAKITLQLIRPHDCEVKMELDRVFSIKPSDKIISEIEAITGENSIELVF